MVPGLELASKIAFSAEEIYRTFYEFSSEAILVLDGDTGHILDANDRGCLLLAYSLEELRRFSLDDLRLPDPAALPGEKNVKVAAAAQGIPQRLEWRLNNGHGSTFWAEISLSPAQRVGDRVVVAYIHSIDAKKRLEETVRSIARGSATLTGQALFDAMARQISRLFGADIVLIGALERAGGYRVRSLSLYEDGRLVPGIEYDLQDSEGSAVCSSASAEALLPGELYLRQHRIESSIGVPLCDSRGGLRGLLACFFRSPVDDPGFVESAMEVAASRAAVEMERSAAGSAAGIDYRHVFESVNDAVLILDRGVVLECNRKALRLFGYTDLREIAGRRIGTLSPLVQSSGQRSGEELQKKIAAALEGRPQSFEWDFRRSDGKMFFAECSLGAFRADGHDGLVALVHNVTRRKLVQDRLVRHNRKLLRSVEGLSGAIAAVIEARDPYTSGHLRRVAEFSCAIAGEMGWPAERIGALRLAAMIHDIGKVSVPAEILGKPGALSETERGIVNLQPQASFDILKTIEFPWPIAEIVRQRCERWDGSGFPGGLSGEAILPEARILGVADSVEAMLSRRPYRSPAGIDRALAEIQAERGTRYDPAVVDACVRLFTEKRITLA